MSVLTVAIILLTLYDIVVYHMPQRQAAALLRPASTNDLMTEIDAMQKVGTALAELSDDARVRVLQWAADRFLQTPVAARPAPAPAAAPPATPQDASLAVDGLGEFFQDALAQPYVERTPRAGDEPLESMVKGFVDDFQRLAREWQGA
jgi:hypothetical protein